MTLQTATEYLNTLFSKTSGDIITLPEAYSAFDRDAHDARANRIWLGNKLTFLKRYDLVKPLYIMKDNSQVLEKLQLTAHGKSILQRPEVTTNGFVEEAPSLPKEVPEIPKNNTAITLTEVIEMLSELHKKDKESTITFDIKLREGIVSVRMAQA